MHRRLELMLTRATAIFLLGCRSGNTEAAPSLSCVPFVLEERPGPKCPSPMGPVDWQGAWRLGSAFECRGTYSRPGGEWHPKSSDGGPGTDAPVLELFNDGFVVRVRGREEPWRVRAVGGPAPHEGASTLFACPWQREGECLLLHFDWWAARDGRQELQILSDDLSHLYGVELWSPAPERVDFDGPPSWRPPNPLPQLAIPDAITHQQEALEKRSAPRLKRMYPSDGLKIHATSVVGGTPKAVEQSIDSQTFSSLRACYDTALWKAPDLSGSLHLALTVAPAGLVTKVAVEANTQPKPPPVFLLCVQRVAETLELGREAPGLVSATVEVRLE